MVDRDTRPQGLPVTRQISDSTHTPIRVQSVRRTSCIRVTAVKQDTCLMSKKENREREDTQQVRDTSRMKHSTNRNRMRVRVKPRYDDDINTRPSRNRRDPVYQGPDFDATDTHLGLTFVSGLVVSSAFGTTTNAVTSAENANINELAERTAFRAEETPVIRDTTTKTLSGTRNSADSCKGRNNVSKTRGVNRKRRD